MKRDRGLYVVERDGDYCVGKNIMIRTHSQGFYPLTIKEVRKTFCAGNKVYKLVLVKRRKNHVKE